MSARLREARILLSCLSFRRVWNIVQVWASYWLARLLQRPIQWGLPIGIGFEPTTACNLRCPQCPSGLRSFSRPTGRLKPEVYEKVIDELAPSLTYLLLYFQGEPYLNPHFLDLVAYARTKGLYTYTSTNGHFLDDANAKRTVESGLSHLIVSIDGTTQEAYSKYRIGGQLQAVTTGLENLIRWKAALKSATPFVELQFIVFAHNEHQIPEVKALGKQLGVDRVAIKTAQVYEADDPEGLIPTEGQYSRYQKTAAGFQIKNKLLNHCWKLWSGAEITWDGRVLPCCFDKDAQHQLGQVPQEAFRSIWHSGKYKAFRQKLLRSRAQIDICQNCTEGTKVWAFRAEV